MAVTVTPGGTADDSYISVSDADAYHEGRGNAAWANLDDDTKEVLLRQATDYMGQAYGLAWAGSRASDDQALDWPRADVCAFGIDVLSTIIPPNVARACAVLALKAASGPLSPDLGRVIQSQKIGPIETTYADYSPQSKRYLSVDRMLAPYLAGAGGSVYSARLERG